MNYSLPHGKRRDPKLIAGLFLLVLANFTQYLTSRWGFGHPDGVDLVHGMLMGAAIGLLLWSVASSRCRAPEVDG